MNGEMNDFTAHITTGAMVVYFIEYLKASGWFPWLHADSKQVSRIVSAGAAAALAFGITATGDYSSGWVVQIPSAPVLLHGLWHWAEQYTTQQLIYDGVAQRAGKARVTP